MRHRLLFTRPSLSAVAASVILATFTFPTANSLKAQDRDQRIRDHFHRDQLRRDPRRVPPRTRAPITLERFRTIDGSNNNEEKVAWGKPGNNLRRLAPAVYADGLNELAGQDRLSPRVISNLVFAQEDSVLNARGMSSMVWQWGQFLDHDIDLTESGVIAEPEPIAIPIGDVFFDPFGTGQAEITFFRSEFNANTGTTRARQQVNFITSWIDGSNVYGSDDETADELRTFEGGKMKTSEGNLLPLGEDGFFMAGDIRANEQVGLTAMHTLFVREHNRIASRYAIIRPEYNDEQIYLRARRLVIAQMQAITVNEFLPALMGPNNLRPYRGYKPDVSPKIFNSFSTAAYRLGHSMLPTALERLTNEGQTLTGGDLPLRDAFFNPSYIQLDGIEPYLMGLCHQQCQELDAKIVDDVRNFLFGPPGSGGFDLVSLNIQRGRDHGLPDYNTLRIAAGVPAARSFMDITLDPTLIQDLQDAYDSDIDNIDAWVGMLAEEHVPGGNVGPTIHAIMQIQFEALRDGDRFWYERHLAPDEVERMNNTRLYDVIRRNSTISVGDMPENVFFVPLNN